MTRKLGKWASNDGQIIKSGLSDGGRVKFIPSVVGTVYDLLRYECHLGNVGLISQLDISQVFANAQATLARHILHTCARTLLKSLHAGIRDL